MGVKLPKMSNKSNYKRKIFSILFLASMFVFQISILISYFNFSAKSIEIQEKSFESDLPSISSAASDYILDWNVKIGGSYEDYALAIAVDSNDYIYVAGWQDLTGTGTNRDIVFVKYNSTGHQQWIRYWGGSEDDKAYDLVIDSADNIYIVGLTKSFGDIDGDVVIIKYNNTGIQQWNFTWGGSNAEVGSGIDFDTSNNFYVTGWTMSLGDTDGDAFLIKFNSTWQEQWIETWGGANKEECGDVHVDSDNVIYTSGRTDSIGSGGDAFILKYNSTGDLQWDETWGASYAQTASGIATDSLHNIYAVGMTFGHPASSGKGVLLKYDTDGNYQWEKIWGYNNVFNNYFYRVMIDSDDELYITGITRSLGIPGNDDAIFFNYDTAGNQNWYKIWSENQGENLNRICMDNKKNIYSVGATSSSTAGGNDILLLKYSYEPQIFINSPSENKVFGTTAPDYSLTILGSYEDVWYTLDNGITNINISSLTGIINQTEWDKKEDGPVIIEFYTNNTFGTESSTEVLVYKDTKYPIIIINEPDIDDSYASIAPNFDISITEPNLHTSWYTIDDGITNINFTGSTGMIEQTEWDKKPNGPVIIKFYANDTVGHENFAEVIVHKHVPVNITDFYIIIIVVGVISVIGIVTIGIIIYRKKRVIIEIPRLEYNKIKKKKEKKKRKRVTEMEPKLINCPFCHTEITTDQNYCTYCGGKLNP